MLLLMAVVADVILFYSCKRIRKGALKYAPLKKKKIEHCARKERAPLWLVFSSVTRGGACAAVEVCGRASTARAQRKRTPLSLLWRGKTGTTARVFFFFSRDVCRWRLLVGARISRLRFRSPPSNHIFLCLPLFSSSLHAWTPSFSKNPSPTYIPSFARTHRGRARIRASHEAASIPACKHASSQRSLVL